MRSFKIQIANFTPLCPLLGPNRGQSLNLHKIESPFPKDPSYQIWLKSMQWFRRRSHLKDKFMDNGTFCSGELKASHENLKIL